MTKIYYLGLLVIIGLVVWLAVDYRANLAEADNVRKIIPDKPLTPDISIAPLKLPPYPTADMEDLWKPYKVDIPQPSTPTAIVTKPSYILTSTIILPNESIATIRNPARNNEEKPYRIGDKLDEWEVIEIIPEEAKLKNKVGEILHLKMQQEWKSSKVMAEDIQKIAKGLDLSPIPGVPPELWDRIMEGKEPSEQVEKYIETIVPTLPPDFVKKTIEEWTGIPKSEMPTDSTKLAEYSKNMYRIVEGKAVEKGASTENVSFALRVNPDNSPIDQKGTFKTSDRRLYACFPNQGELNGLDKVITRWRNKTTGEVVRLDTKPIDPKATHNFIWIEKRDGWPSGEYEVELINSQTLRKIAEGNFNVVP